ncbi:MAG: M23 family metallopeptidase [Clostridiales bacterium]|nr:M23 family metallopeptidase [Clostridiales bacterium]
MQEHKEKEKKTKRAKKWNGEKRFYLFTALGCVAALTAIVIVAVAISGGDKGKLSDKVDNTPTVETPDDTPTPPNDNEQVSTLPEGMISPIELVSVTHEYGFYHNDTLNCYYEHKGMDFSAEVGTKVLAVEDGKVESVYTSDVLLGTEITIDHGNGVKSVYRFVTEAEGLKVGDTVKKGDVIATVAEASGNEYKQGAHLHFEIVKNNTSVDPSTYLTLEEK